MSLLRLAITEPEQQESTATTTGVSRRACQQREQIANSDGELIGLITGIRALDLVTTGIRGGEFWMVVGRTGDGKSALTLQMAAANCRQEIPVGLFSIEMSKADVLQRLWSVHGGIPCESIRNPRGIGAGLRARVKRAMAEVRPGPLFIVEDGALTIQKLLATARLMIRQEKVRQLIVDYVQLVATHAANERERLMKISNQLPAAEFHWTKGILQVMLSFTTLFPEGLSGAPSF